MLLEVNNLSVNYGIVKAIENISLNVLENEIVAIIGPNGAGKSTSLKAIAGLFKLTSGEIIFQGECINNLPPYELARKGIVLVPEGRRIFATMTVFENLEMGAYIRNDKNAIKEDMNMIFGLFPILKERLNQQAGTLSTGEQQMLSIGRALMLKPKLLLLDEPSFGLSPNYAEIVFEKLKQINQCGTAILVVEQNARLALEYADRGYVYKIGGLFLEDSAKNLLLNENIKKSFLGE